MFDIHQSIYTDEDDWDEELSYEYREGLMEAFAESPEAREHMETHGSLGWSASMLDFAFDYLGVTPPEMSLRDLREILYQLFPRKVSAEAQAAGEIVDELRAFWRFVEREYGLPQASEFIEELDEEAERALHRELADPANFGLAKSFFMMGQQAGFDMTTQEGNDQFAAAYNATILDRTDAGQMRGGNSGSISASAKRAKRKARKKAIKKQRRRR
jgi:hypothetical protein